VPKDRDRTYHTKFGCTDIAADTGTIDALAVTTLQKGGLAVASVLPSVAASGDPASIAAAGSGTVELTVTGALAADQVLVSVPAGLTAGLVIRNAYVSAADTVTVELGNFTAAAINAGVTSFLVTLIR
jgi:hypothetical protein